MSTIKVTNIALSNIRAIVGLGLHTKELRVSNEGPIYYQPSQLKNFIKNRRDIHLVAKIDNHFAGYLLASYNSHLKECYLIDVAVKPEYRHHGVGQALYRQMYQRLYQRKCAWCWALVQENNQPMTKFMKKHGFSRGKKFHIFYKDQFTPIKSLRPQA